MTDYSKFVNCEVKHYAGETHLVIKSDFEGIPSQSGKSVIVASTPKFGKITLADGRECEISLMVLDPIERRQKGAGKADSAAMQAMQQQQAALQQQLAQQQQLMMQMLQAMQGQGNGHAQPVQAPALRQKPVTK